MFGERRRTRIENSGSELCGSMRMRKICQACYERCSFPQTGAGHNFEACVFSCGQSCILDCFFLYILIKQAFSCTINSPMLHYMAQ